MEAEGSDTNSLLWADRIIFDRWLFMELGYDSYECLLIAFHYNMLRKDVLFIIRSNLVY